MNSKVGYISFLQPVNPDTGSALLGACKSLVSDGISQIHILMSTSGGNIMTGFAVYDELRGLPAKITTHNTGSINSIGNVMFLAGENRLATPTASFLFHGTFWNFGPDDIPRRSISEALDSLLADEQRIEAVILERTNLDKEVLKKMFDVGATKDSKFALENGIIGEIQEVSISPNASMVQI